VLWRNICLKTYFIAAGDMDGQAVWKRILKVIEELQSKERPDGEKLH